MSNRHVSSGNHWSHVWKVVRPQRGRVFVLAGASFARGTLEAVFLVIVTRTALAIAENKGSTGILADQTVSISTALAIGAALVAGRLIVALGAAILANRVTVRVVSELRRDLAAAFLKASWATQQAEPAGRLQQLVAGFAGSSAQVVTAFTTSLSASISLIALIVGALLVDTLATIAIVFALLVLAGVLTPIRYAVKRRARERATAQLQFSSSVSELGSLGLEMQAFGVRDQFIDRIRTDNRRLTTAHRRAADIASTLVPTYTSLAYAALLAGLAAASLADVGKLSSLGAVMLVMLRSLSYGQQLQTASANLLQSLPNLERVEEAFEVYGASLARDRGETPERVGAIVAHQASFGYSPEVPVLSDLDFEIRTGETVGVIGPSGAGKSTLVQLLLGVREPTSGAVTVSGIDLARIDRTWWSKQVAFVAQDAVLFTGTVAENIRFLRPGIDDEAVRDAAKRANVLEDIEALPSGFDTHLGERATRLSGGQRQRVSIARALVGRPRVLILDEPTSALDVRSEKLIRDTVESLKGNVTVVVIAHRMSTLDMCDRIMVLEGGRIVGFDEPSQLRESNEFYRHALELSGIQ